MEKIMEREVAWRIFAFEFNRSNLYVSEGDDRAPNYIITPTGVKCNRLFIVGVVTEVENIGRENNLWRARVADPTGVFTLYAGQYQPEAAIFLSELQVPSYVAVVGKARKYEPEEGSVYISVRPEEINTADEKLRDRWVIDTAERTLERLRIMEEALKSGLSGNELKEFLQKKGIPVMLAEGVVRAVEHYKNLDKIIAELKDSLVHALESVASVKTAEKLKEPQIKTPEVLPQRARVAPLEGADTYAQRAYVDTKSRSVAFGADVNLQGSGNDERRLEEPPVEKPEENVKETEVIETEAQAEIKESVREPKEILAAIIEKLDTGKGISYSEVVEAAQSEGIGAEQLESSIKELMAEGRCYEPKIGVLRKVQE